MNNLLNNAILTKRKIYMSSQIYLCMTKTYLSHNRVESSKRVTTSEVAQNGKACRIG